MEVKKIEAVIFDLGNVLVNFDHTIAAKRIAPFCNKTIGEIFNLFFSSGITVLFEEGKISPRDFFLEVQKMLGLKLTFDQFLPIWNEIFFLTGDNRQVAHLAQGLKGEYKLAILSNINTLHFEYLKEHFDIFCAFDHKFVSFEMGLVKPNPVIYQKVIESLGVSSPEKVFYTDDRAELVSAANNLGFKSVVFKNCRQLKQDMAAAGMKVG